MATPILATKLFIPPPRPQLVQRRHLVDRLDQGLLPGRKLTVLAASAGFGKTTLLSEWAADLPDRVAWLSLDANDNDLQRFLAYLVAALQTVDAHLGVGALSLLVADTAPQAEPILTALLNDVARSPRDLLLVLDDYHEIQLSTIHEAVTFLIDHLPPQLHVAVSSRSDPPLPLARLRARGELTELRAADLRFGAAEGAAFLNEVMGLGLSTEHVATLETRTEGWIAGLQLAALSMRGRGDVSAFIQAFAGDHRYIADYLVEEVLERQPEPVRRFLLETSILDRLNGALCDAVTGQTDGGARLDALERGNLFVVPLDDTRRWFRYHHLFAEVLGAHLRTGLPDDAIATLHGRASAWHELNGSPSDAIRHALAARAFTRAADLIEKAAADFRRTRQEATLLAWLRALPDDLVRTRPILSYLFAGALMQLGEHEGVDAKLRDAERWLDAVAQDTGGRPAGVVVANEAELGRLPGLIAVHRAAHALVLRDVAGTQAHARRALELVSDDDHLGRGSASALLGLAAWTNGDLTSARRSYTVGMALLQRAGHFSDVLGCAIALADMQIALGCLSDAQRTYEQALRLGPGGLVLRGAADMLVGLSDLQRERNELAAALEGLERSRNLGEHRGLPQYPYRERLVMARVRQAQGDLDAALDLLADAERRYDGDFSPNVRPIAAWRTRILVAQGRLGEAEAWVNAQTLSCDDDLSYLREFEHLTLARVRLAQAHAEGSESPRRAALSLLARLESAAQAGGRVSNLIEVLVLRSLATQAQGELPAGLETLERALALAEPEGYVRTFADEGAPLAPLLRGLAATTRPMAAYAKRLLDAIEPQGPVAAIDPAPTQALAEPLSEREREVLRLLSTELSGPEIARQLVVSLNTFNTHTRNIYGKLGVNNRRAAVRRAEELRLL